MSKSKPPKSPFASIDPNQLKNVSGGASRVTARVSGANDQVMQMLTGDSLDGQDISVFSLQKRHQATVYEKTVDQYCAGTALALSTAFLWAGESQVLTQYVEQSFHRICGHGFGFAVHGERDIAHRCDLWRIAHRRRS